MGNERKIMFEVNVSRLEGNISQVTAEDMFGLVVKRGVLV